MYAFTIRIGLLLLLIPKALHAQNSSVDSVSYYDKYGIRLGLDISKPIRMLLEEDYRGFELVADIRISRRFFAAVELGNEEKTIDEDQYNFTSKGSYAKVGADFNAYRNWLGMQNIIGLGMRVGYSLFDQQLNSYRIYNTNQYWTNDQGDLEGNIVVTEGDLIRSYNDLNAVWIEAVASIKAEIFTNLYMGFSFRLNYLISDSEPTNFKNLFIPGFNRVNDFGQFGLGFNYTISYLIPILKRDR